MSKATENRVPCSNETRDRLKAAKRGGENYNQLLRKMLEQYDPQAAHEPKV